MMIAKLGNDTVEVRGSEIVVTLDGTEYRASGFRPGACHRERDQMIAALGCLGAAGASNGYHGRKMKEGSNTDLFCETVVEWSYKYYDEITMQELELTEHESEE